MAIEVHPISNTISVLVHEIDYTDDRVLVSVNDGKSAWCPMDEQLNEETEAIEPGFLLGELFIPFSEVLRL